MDLFEEGRLRLLYHQNLTHANVINIRHNEKLKKSNAFKQQYNSKLEGLFEYECIERNVGDFKYTGLDNKEEGENGIVICCENRKTTTKNMKKKNAVVIELTEKEEKNINIDRCIGCKNEYVAGVNMSVRIKYEKIKKRERKERKKNGKNVKDKMQRSRILEIKCHICGVSVLFKNMLLKSGLHAKKEEKKQQQKSMPLNILPLVSTNGDRSNLNATNNISTGTADKKSKKKKKKSGLRELLQRKQQQDREGDNNNDPLGLLKW
jgi:ribosomal protein S27E